MQESKKMINNFNGNCNYVKTLYELGHGLNRSKSKKKEGGVRGAGCLRIPKFLCLSYTVAMKKMGEKYIDYNFTCYPLNWFLLSY